MTALFQITAEPLDSVVLQQAVADPACGAIVVFTGVARNNFGGRATAYLEYEAYSPMAERVFAELAAEAKERYAIGAVAIHHRIGTLSIGEAAVAVVVAAPHRGAAFAAAAWIMDMIKERAPIWKREHWADGTSEWIGNEKTRA